jgi:hypothetical protein
MLEEGEHLLQIVDLLEFQQTQKKNHSQVFLMLEEGADFKGIVKAANTAALTTAKRWTCQT